ncbi:MAG: hypothetical protein HN368_07285 [Spirochaetales bacterium]|nr:hypothetical protein [Spirochaetales bacterium]
MRYIENPAIPLRLKAAEHILSRYDSQPETYFRQTLSALDRSYLFLSAVVLAPLLNSPESGGLKKTLRTLRKSGKIRRSEESELQKSFKLIPVFAGWQETSSDPGKMIPVFPYPAFDNEPGRSYIGVNVHENISWFSREGLGDFMFRLYTLALVDLYAEYSKEEAKEKEDLLFTSAGMWAEALYQSEYRVDRFITFLSQQEPNQE